jgi:hypothetical protein
VLRYQRVQVYLSDYLIKYAPSFRLAVSDDLSYFVRHIVLLFINVGQRSLPVFVLQVKNDRLYDARKYFIQHL